MVDEGKMKAAKSTFEALCKTLDKEDWQYEKDEDALIIESSTQGEDLPMDITILVDPEKSLVLLMSHLPFVTQEDKRMDMAIAVSAVNYLLVDGFFDFDITSGQMIFRMTNSFLESLLGEKLFLYMVLVSCHTVDEYNDRFLMLSKDLMSLEQFLDSIKQVGGE